MMNKTSMNENYKTAKRKASQISDFKGTHTRNSHLAIQQNSPFQNNKITSSKRTKKFLSTNTAMIEQ